MSREILKYLNEKMVKARAQGADEFVAIAHLKAQYYPEITSTSWGEICAAVGKDPRVATETRMVGDSHRECWRYSSTTTVTPRRGKVCVSQPTRLY